MTSSELSLAIRKRPQDITFERCMICMTITYLLVMNPIFQGSLLKILSSITLIISEILALSTIFILYKNKYLKYTQFQKIILFLLFGYNIFLIITGILSPEYKFLSFWGNTGYQPAFFLPFYILVGSDMLLFRILFKYILIYSFAIILSIPLGIGSMVSFGYLIFFLIAFAKFYNRKTLYVVFIVGAIYILACLIEDARTPAIRTIISFLIYLYSCIHSKVKSFCKKMIMVIVMILPLYFFYLFTVTGESVFSSALGEGGDHSVDTRTFLYEEVLLDIVDNEAVIMGKGINGSYYSNYFFNHDGDSADRVNLEVGFLSLLLKGGAILTVLSLLILMMAIYLSFIKTQFLLMNIIGALLLMHYLLLFLEHIPQYGLLYMTFQFLIGMSLVNNKISWDDEKIKLLFNTI